MKIDSVVVIKLACIIYCIRFKCNDKVILKYIFYLVEVIHVNLKKLRYIDCDTMY